MSKIITEVTPLSEKDCFYLVDRRKDEFNYPLHRHEDVEVNFVCNCAGCKRIVGDSIEVLDYYDLVIIGSGLEHYWDQNGVQNNGDMREITIQMSSIYSDNTFLVKDILLPMQDFFKRARLGIAFGQEFIKKSIPLFEALLEPQPGYLRMLKLYELLYYMAVTDDCRTLSTSSFAKINDSSDSRRISRVEEYISQNYASQLRLDELAALAHMTPTAFSRFFRTHTGRTLSDYIIDMRIGHATRLLVDSNMTSMEICFRCGFNNVSNFNRLFRKKKGCSPMQFRDNYLKTKIIV